MGIKIYLTSEKKLESKKITIIVNFVLESLLYPFFSCKNRICNNLRLNKINIKQGMDK